MRRIIKQYLHVCTLSDLRNLGVDNFLAGLKKKIVDWTKENGVDAPIYFFCQESTQNGTAITFWFEGEETKEQERLRKSLDSWQRERELETLRHLREKYEGVEGI